MSFWWPRPPEVGLMQDAQREPRGDDPQEPQVDPWAGLGLEGEWPRPWAVFGHAHLVTPLSTALQGVSGEIMELDRESFCFWEKKKFFLFLRFFHVLDVWGSLTKCVLR